MNRIESAPLRRINAYRAWPLALVAAVALLVAPAPA